MDERTRFGTTPHSQKVVQGSDAYSRNDEPQADGKIKRTSVRGSLRSQEVVCTLFFATCNGTLQGEGVPLSSLSRLFSTPKWVAHAMCGMSGSAIFTLQHAFFRHATIAARRVLQRDFCPSISSGWQPMTPISAFVQDGRAVAARASIHARNPS
jgi:hypothetical protein